MTTGTQIITTQDIYIDSESLGSYNNFDVILPHPIIISENEKAYICLKDFQMLNSMYNISSDLQNNTFTILHTTRTYNRTPTGNNIDYFVDTNLFRTANPNIRKPILNSINDGIAHTETLTANAGNFTIKLYDSTITTSGEVIPANSKFSNIFNTGLTTAFMSFAPTDYLVYYNYNDLTESRFAYGCEVVVENITIPILGNRPTTNINVGVEVSGSIDGINWTNLGVVGQNYAEFLPADWSYTLQQTFNFTFITTGCFQYHKVSFISAGVPTTPPSTPNTLKELFRFKRILLTKKASFTETIADSTLTYNKTIEDGFYSITNLNALLNYYLKEHISSNLTFSNFISSKPFLIAQNKQVLAWSSTEPIYYYKETDKIDESYKVEVQFNSILRKMLGWISPTSTGNIILLRTDGSITAPNYLNLINFKKILLTSSLKLTTKPYTFLNKNYTKSSGIGDIFAWVSKDIASFSYINWTNPTDAKTEIDDKNITKINFKIINEYAQVMNDVPSCNFHLQIIKIRDKK
jgi:hypothetical protein